MSDFEAALERLLSDPGFARQLAADPVTALAGYRLSADEVEVLTTQLSDDPVGESTVEIRTNQSSLGGFLSPLTSLGSAGSAIGSALGPADHGMGAAPPDGGQGGGALSGFGAPGVSGFGSAAPQAGDGLAGLGAVTDGSEEGTAGFGKASAEPDPPAPELPEGYQTRVDVDGDGNWDQHTLRAREDGGVDILVDLDGDGRVDFIGHDDNADGMVNWAEYDTTGDGVFDTRMHDDDGDGWMDRTEPAP